MPRSRSVLHTEKHPGRCPNCGGTAVSRRGTRSKKFETVQRWRCASCNRGFTPATPELRAKSYPLRVILDAVTLYNLGYTVAQVGTKLKSKTGYRVSSSTLAAWIAGHRDLATYARLRGEESALYSPAQTIRATKLYHRQVYEYANHQPKLAFLCESGEHARFAGLADFLETVPKRCPHNLFQESTRASDSAPAFLDRSRLAERDRLEQRAAPAFAWRRKRAVVEFLDFFGERAVGFGEREQLSVPQRCQHPTSTSRTAFSAVGLSRGLLTRAGTIATP